MWEKIKILLCNLFSKCTEKQKDNADKKNIQQKAIAKEVTMIGIQNNYTAEEK